jgi:hypothetical protein
MDSPWGMVDSLMRELGALRNEARSLDSRDMSAEVAAEVERCIGEAAQAIDEAIATPEDEDRLLGVCEAILVARARIETLQSTARRSRDLIAHSQELRRQNVRLLYETLRRR